jgi:hypothetical protein
MHAAQHSLLQSFNGPDRLWFREVHNVQNHEDMKPYEAIARQFRVSSPVSGATLPVAEPRPIGHGGRNGAGGALFV